MSLCKYFSLMSSLLTVDSRVDLDNFVSLRDRRMMKLAPYIAPLTLNVPPPSQERNFIDNLAEKQLQKQSTKIDQKEAKKHHKAVYKHEKRALKLAEKHKKREVKAIKKQAKREAKMAKKAKKSGSSKRHDDVYDSDSSSSSSSSSSSDSSYDLSYGRSTDGMTAKQTEKQHKRDAKQEKRIGKLQYILVENL
jgi:hypothetical protein